MEGRLSPEDRYPPADRFIKLKEPLAYCFPLKSVWGQVPFHGSLIVPLSPYNKKDFNRCYKNLGLSSDNLEIMIDFAKETGKIQFLILEDLPSYEELEFLRPLFEELRPPKYFSLAAYAAELGNLKRDMIEFDTLAQVGVYSLAAKSLEIVHRSLAKSIVRSLAENYAILKAFCPEDLIDKIKDLLVINPAEALDWLTTLQMLIIHPLTSMLKPIYTYDIETRVEANKMTNVKVETFPYEVGKFILEKVVAYPENIEGCWEVIQHYENLELYKVAEDLWRGVKEQDPSLVSEKTTDLSIILDNAWKDAGKIEKKSLLADAGVTVNLGLIGELVGGLGGATIGILGGLGFQAADRLLELKLEGIGEKIAKFLSPNYLVTIYDFRKRHHL